MDRRQTHRSKRLSWLLRHGATEVGMPMDEAGWVDIELVLARLHMGRAELDEIVRLNDKRRLQVDGTRIRACQGHSLDNAAVTVDGLERSWKVFDGPAIWHGTRVDVVGAIARDGILPIARTHVHCAPSPKSVVGKRSGVALLLEIDPQRIRRAGFEVYEAQNGVVLVRKIPAACVVGLVAMSKRAKAREGELRTALGLGSGNGNGSGSGVPGG